MPRSFHSRLAAVVALGLLSLPVVACSVHTCTLIGCSEGLNIAFQGDLPAGSTLEIEIAMLTTTPELVPVMSCSLSSLVGNEQRLLCKSSFLHTVGERTVHFAGSEIKSFVVTVSRDGSKLSEEQFDATYTSEEINGPGCGVCTGASVQVDLPPIAP